MGAWPQVSLAQDTGAPAPAATTGDEDIVITGSFIRGTPEDTALPVESTTLQEIQNMGSPSNMDFVKNMTEIGSVVGETNRYNAYPVGAETINLRNLSSTRTVILFNGRRFPEQYSIATGRFNNIAQIPNAAIGRIDVLKEGGSTAYGADAIGGIVNYITRHDFNGLQVNGNYRYIADTDGDYDGDLLWGASNDDGNVMLSAGFRHRSTLLEVDRDFADRPFLENDNGFAWSTSGSPGAYVFLRSSGTRITPSIFTGGGYTGDRQMSISGIVRDPNCTDVGGYAGWSSTPSPVCYYHIVNNEKLAEDEDTYQAYGEVNYRFGESLKFHGEGLYYGLRLPDIAAHPGDAFLNVPIDASSATGAQQNIGGTAAYFVAGANPAVADMLGKLTNSDGVTTAYTTGQISDIIAGGRAGLVLGTWRPFGFGGNPLTGKAYDNQTNQTDQFRFTGEFSGDNRR
jgi:iron complex outermembrane receptor protein